MPFRITTAVIAGLLSTIFGAWVLIKNPRGKSNQSFALFNLALAAWNSEELIAYVDNHFLALVLCRLCYVVGSFIGFFTLKFIFSIINKEISKPYFIIKWLSVVFAFLSMTAWVIKDVHYDVSPSMSNGELTGILYFPYVLFLAVVLAIDLYYLIVGLRSSSGHMRNQLRYIALAVGLGIVAVVIFILNQVNRNIPPLHFIVQLGIIPLFSYAIIKHRLMDIGVFVRRFVLLISVYILLILVCVPVLVGLHSHYFSAYPQFTRPLIQEVSLLAVILSIGPFLYAYLVRRGSYFHEHEMAGLTHELKSPLANIQSAMDFLQDIKEGDRFRTAHADYMDMINRNTTRLERAVNELIKVFRLPAGSEPFKFEVVDLRKILSGAVSANEERAKEKGLEIHLSVPDHEIPIKIDSEKIQQAVSNLLSNAIKYTSSGSITLKVEERNDFVEVSVIDTGAGILSDELPLVFDRFFQGKAGKGAKGSGIGLTIAKTWVEAHGGEIHAESAGPGKGSRFWFTLPKS